MSGLRRFISTTVGLAVALTSVAAFAADSAARGADSDPWEGFNRAMFAFNDTVDVYALEPVAKGWNWIAPRRLQRCLSNFFDNLRFPIDAVNNLLQGKVVRSAAVVGRFGVNTTVGMLGFFDPATAWGLEAHNEDFGQTLGVWGVPPGPYLVWPLLGPSSPRETIGLAADYAGAIYFFFVPLEYTAASRAVSVVNDRARVLDDLHDLKQASLDYYAAVRNAYIQRRAALVEDRGGMSQGEEEELYKIDNGE